MGAREPSVSPRTSGKMASSTTSPRITLTRTTVAERRRRTRNQRDLRRRTLWFGQPWPIANDPAAVCRDDTNRCETPVGQECCYCDEAILLGESGVLFATQAPRGWETIAWHKECLVRHYTGSIAHRQGMCSCNGHPEPDLGTIREDALFNYRHLQSQFN